jgi:hypothetical protein
MTPERSPHQAPRRLSLFALASSAWAEQAPEPADAPSVRLLHAKASAYRGRYEALAMNGRDSRCRDFYANTGQPRRKGRQGFPKGRLREADRRAILANLPDRPQRPVDSARPSPMDDDSSAVEGRHPDFKSSTRGHRPSEPILERLPARAPRRIRALSPWPSPWKARGSRRRPNSTPRSRRGRRRLPLPERSLGQGDTMPSILRPVRKG